ncbi:uncharacterized protein ATNIH1004_000439 [Aspergillus tanneri]|uniref:Uncharacterized protein n=1 Tax=Aspergillus tanneri TaxID=1220188 RepID=A0A5M9N3G0_9EURO|nr:uncharacterized protein ATNIH1004_000439 [Aspergillus tanneri]KAA8651549.1 hypothetical protein ATNIH1004_000439 [Aspergillus tanneri]
MPCVEILQVPIANAQFLNTLEPSMHFGHCTHEESTAGESNEERSSSPQVKKVADCHGVDDFDVYVKRILLDIHSEATGILLLSRPPVWSGKPLLAWSWRE